jgi:glucose-1-phosphate thymidylyltransferase
VLGPHVSLGAGAVVRNALISDSIINAGAQITGAILTGSVIGDKAVVTGAGQELNVGDASSTRIR